MSNSLTREQKERQVSYWRLIGACFGQDDLARPFQDQTAEIIRREDLPPALLDAAMPIDIMLQRNPGLKQHMAAISELVRDTGEPQAEPGSDEEEDDQIDGKAEAGEAIEPPAPVSPIEPSALNTARTLFYSKVLLNVFGPNTRSPQCSAQQYTQWLKDVEAFEECFGFAPGTLRGSAGPGGGGSAGGPGSGPGGGPGGNRELIDDGQLRSELQAMESDIIQRMDLLEVLSDDNLAKCITPTAAVVEQLMHLKTKLSGKALGHARALIRKYVDQLAEVLRKQVISTSTGRIDRSVPPKKVFRNLDLRRTIWKNLPNYSKLDGKLYVDQLYYRQTAQRELNNYLIVVVDQSGSMVDAMTQCAILASIFAKLPRVKVTLLAFDTSVIDLTQWVEDPFESLMRTNLGGGNDGPLAMAEARARIVDPRRTTMVWISDFYERRELMPMITAVKQSCVHFLPVASVSGTGYYSMDGWFKDELKKIGCPVLTGNIKKLIVELKKQLR